MIKARPCAGDIAAGAAFARGAFALHLAQISRFRRPRRHPRDEAADSGLSRLRRSRGRRPQRQARPRRHPRDRVLRPDPAADRRRPPPGAARPRDARDPASSSRAAAGSTPMPATISKAPTRSCAPSSIACRWSPTSRPIRCPRAGGARGIRPLHGLSRPRRLRGGAARPSRRGAAPLCAAVRGRAGARRRAPRPRLSAQGRRPRNPRQAERDGVPPADRGVADGAALARRRAAGAARDRRRAQSSPSSCRSSSTTSRAPKTPMPRSSPSTAFSATCMAARGCSRCCGRTPTSSRSSRSVLGTAPRLADTLAAHPQVMDALIDPSFFGALPGPEALEAALAVSLAQAGSHEDFLDRVRAFGQEQMFLIGARILSGTVSAQQAGEAFAGLADTVVRALHRRDRRLVPGGPRRAARRRRARCSPWASSAAAR